MNGIHLTTVTRITVKSNNPKLTFFADWLIPMGFVAGSLVQFIPESNGLSFTLCENIPKYSELANATRQKGGTFVHANIYRHREYPSISIAGAAFMSTGLKCGDLLLMRYEYGFIRMRKLPTHVGKIVTARLFGQWLEGLGFTPDSVVLVGSEKGLIDCQLQENGLARTYELVKHARLHKLNLLQVQAQRDNNKYPQFEIPKSRFEKAGFEYDDSFLASYEYGRIILRQIDFDALGFNA